MNQYRNMGVILSFLRRLFPDIELDIFACIFNKFDPNERAEFGV